MKFRPKKVGDYNHAHCSMIADLSEKKKFNLDTSTSVYSAK